ncbi:MAG TPA: DUF58 domain-containing protein [Chitinophagales bacterium]|nr:DUF58 domain-containing protein [Chitinophagales bacterium]
MESADLLKKVRKIEIKSRGLSNHIFSGEYHSAFKGRGMSFSEVREYQFGDDIKFIDWNVTARLRTPYVKVFEEERELTLMLLIDISPSAFFGTEKQFKSEMITEICAVLAFSAITNNDKVGVIFFGQTIEKFIPPKKGKKHVLRIIRELLDFAYGQKAQQAEAVRLKKADELKNKWWHNQLNTIKRWFNRSTIPHHTPTKLNNQKPVNDPTNIEQALIYFTNVIKRRCIAFVLSDFIGEGYDKALRLAAQKHDVVGVHIYDIHEQVLPDVGMMRVIDAETGFAAWLDTSDKMVRKNYYAAFMKKLDYCKTSFAKSNADLLSIATREDYVKHLISFFKKRGA